MSPRIARDLAKALLLACLLSGCGRQLTEQETRQRDLTERVRGFVDAKDVDAAMLAVTTVEYFGGFRTRFEVQGGQATITRSSQMEGAVKKPPATYTLTPADLENWTDIVNLIVRDKLWEQGDVKTSGVADGGETHYEFKVGAHQGKFRLINSSPEHLYVLANKVANLRNLVEARQSGTMPKK